MKAQRTVGLNLSWPRLTIVFLIDVAVLVLARHWPGSARTATYAWWVGVGIAALVLIVAVVTYRRTPLASAAAARVLDRFVDPEATLAAGRSAGLDHRRRFGQDPVGIREYQGQLVSVIAVTGRHDRRVGRHGQPGAVTLPVGTVATALRQFDVRLEGIDIVSVGVPVAVDTGFGEEPRSVDQRHTWLVLRMDPLHNVAAVAARDSVASTLAAATERLAAEIDGAQCAARPVTAAEIADVDVAVLAGLQPEHIRPRRRRLKHKQPEGDKEFVTSFWVSPQDITSETLEELWESDTTATVVTVRLIPRRGGAEVSAWVRYHSSGRLRKEVWSGLNRLTGRQLVAVSASLPAPAARTPLVVPGRDLPDDEDLAVPLSPAPPPRVEVGARA
ncbi:type VII secretion protein EccE [Mycobacterium sp. pUA109]|uniref:type VII secretion protein EccE n=1 Tax=Mycobacterium sp. pUA109 TaxID=3238982 RepID=UPI00351AFDD4